MSRPTSGSLSPAPTTGLWSVSEALDRRPQLQAEEVAAFAALFAPGSRATLATYAPALQRFHEPIEAALRHCGHGRAPERLRATCWLLYYEMHGRQRSLWGWSEADWVDIAGATTAAFTAAQPALKAAYHLAHTHFRTCVVACAYLLGEVNIYQRITEFRPLLAARRIFGPATVHAAITAVKAELALVKSLVQKLIGKPSGNIASWDWQGTTT